MSFFEETAAQWSLTC